MFSILVFRSCSRSCHSSVMVTDRALVILMLPVFVLNRLAVVTFVCDPSDYRMFVCLFVCLFVYCCR